jgi:hypothetical protein
VQDLRQKLVPTNPRECALAIAIPLSREEFLADLAQPEEKDFVHHFRKGCGIERAAPEFCWHAYEANEALFVKAVCAEVTRFGVTVAYDVELADFADLLRRFPVVSLVAHSRFIPIQPTDILDAFKIIKTLQAPENDVHVAMRQCLLQHDPQLFDNSISTNMEPVDMQTRVAHVLGTVVAEAEKLYTDNKSYLEFDVEGGSVEMISNRLTRLEFEHALPDCLVPARVIEFRDSIHTVSELIASIPPAFTGLLDLTVCNSVIPAAFIRSKRKDCIVAANRGLTELRTRMYFYGLQIRLLAQEPKPFAEAIKEVRLSYKTEDRKLWKLFVKFWNIIRGRR